MRPTPAGARPVGAVRYRHLAVVEFLLAGLQVTARFAWKAPSWAGMMWPWLGCGV
jgi:hypothetical protein